MLRCTPLIVLLAACAPADVRVHPTSISQTGGELLLVGVFPSDRGVVVMVDGVAAQFIIRESEELIRVRVPSLPRTGRVDVELLFADGQTLELADALNISAPQLEVRAGPVGSADLDPE